MGQTLEAPERRWIQHRAEGTGPFKRGAQYVEWKVIRGEVQPAKLNELESYYIGLFNADENGHNDNRGNDSMAYERGRIAHGRQSHKVDKSEALPTDRDPDV